MLPLAIAAAALIVSGCQALVSDRKEETAKKQDQTVSPGSPNNITSEVRPPIENVAPPSSIIGNTNSDRGRVLARATVKIAHGASPATAPLSMAPGAITSGTTIAVNVPSIVQLNVDGQVVFSNISLDFTPADNPLIIAIQDNDTALAEKAYIRVYSAGGGLTGADGTVLPLSISLDGAAWTKIGAQDNAAQLSTWGLNKPPAIINDSFPLYVGANFSQATAQAYNSELIIEFVVEEPTQLPDLVYGHGQAGDLVWSIEERDGEDRIYLQDYSNDPNPNDSFILYPNRPRIDYRLSDNPGGLPWAESFSLTPEYNEYVPTLEKMLGHAQQTLSQSPQEDTASISSMIGTIEALISQAPAGSVDYDIVEGGGAVNGISWFLSTEALSIGDPPGRGQNLTYSLDRQTLRLVKRESGNETAYARADEGYLPALNEALALAEQVAARDDLQPSQLKTISAVIEILRGISGQ